MKDWKGYMKAWDDTLAKQKYWNLTEGDREVPVWPAVTTAPDYLHLALYAASPESCAIPTGPWS